MGRPASDPPEFPQIKEVDIKVPLGTWTRKIAEDLWADRLTPLMADAIIKNTPRFDLSKNSKFLKIPVIKSSLSVINGFLYVNCKALKMNLSNAWRFFRKRISGRTFTPRFSHGRCGGWLKTKAV